MYYDDDILLSITAGHEFLPDVGSVLGTCVAAMSHLCTLWIYFFPLPVLGALAERKRPLEELIVWLPGVNWVSDDVFYQCTSIIWQV